MMRAPEILTKGAIACAGVIFALVAGEFLVRLTSPPTTTSPPARDLPREAAGLPRLKGVFALAKANQLWKKIGA